MTEAPSTITEAVLPSDIADWKPLDRPDHPLYIEVLAEIEAIAKRGKGKEARAYFAAACERDFPFFMLHAHSLGAYNCAEPGHKHYGKPWLTWPWLWDWMLDLHQEFVTKETGVLHIKPRYSLKTAILTGGGASWETFRNRQITIAIITWKFEDTGTKIYGAVRSEFESNRTFKRHWPHVLTDAAIAKFTNKNLTVDRDPGPKEPTVSVHGLDSLPDSQHYDWIIVDDAVVRKTVQTAEGIASTYQKMRGLSALCNQVPRITTVGTRWHLHDPYELGKRDGKYGRIDFSSCYDQDGKTPLLHTKAYLDYQRQEMGPYEFSCHFLGNPTPPDEQRLLRTWLQWYDNDPQMEARNKNRYLLVDPGEGKVDGSLASATEVSLGGDLNYYATDMYRERFGLIEMRDLIFELVERARQQANPYLAVVTDPFTGSAPLVDALKDRQKRDGYRFRLLTLEGTTESKEGRVSYLVPILESGRFWLPEGGFGHGSKHDRRDVKDQFLDSEYDLWSPSGALGDITVLDLLSWLAFPTTKGRFRFPVEAVAAEKASIRRHPSVRDRNKPPGASSGVSPWVF